MISEVAAYVGVIIFSSLGLIYFIAMVFIRKLNNQVKEDFLLIEDTRDSTLQKDPEIARSGSIKMQYTIEKRTSTTLVNQQQVQTVQQITQDQDPRTSNQGNYAEQKMEVNVEIRMKNAIAYQNLVDDIGDTAIKTFAETTVFMFICAAIFMFCFLFWFSPEYAKLWIVFWFIMGILVSVISVFIVMKLSNSALARFIIDSKDNKGTGFTSAYFSAAAIACGLISIMLLTLGSFIPFTKGLFKHAETVQGYTQLFSLIIGYAVGFIFSSFFYRDIGSAISKGIAVGNDLIGKINVSSDEEEEQKRQLKKAEIIGNFYGQNVVTSIDFISILVLIICVTCLLLAQSSNLMKENATVFYMPLYVLSFNLLMSALISLMGGLGGRDPQEEIGTATFTAKQVRMQLMISFISAFLINLIFPWFLLPKTFNIGTEKTPYYFVKDITPGDVVWCLEIGHVTQLIILIVTEFLTSHAFKPTQQIAEDCKQGIGKGMMTNAAYANIGQFIILFLLASLCLWCYIICGFFGIACATVGMLSIPLTVLAISLLSSFTSDGYEFATVARVYGTIRDQIYRMAWAGRNFYVFAQIFNAGGVFLSNVVCIGVMIIVLKITSVQIWSSFTIYGFLYGAALAYFLKGSSLMLIKNVSNEVVNDENKKKEKLGFEENRKDPLFEFWNSKFQMVSWKVMANLFLCLISIVFMSLMFGKEGLIGYILGLNLIGLHITILSILQSNAMRNARFYNESYVNRNSDTINNTIQCDISTSSVDQNTLIMYLAFNTLFVIFGAVVFRAGGGVGKFMQEKGETWPNKSVDWVDKSEDGILKFGRKFGKFMNDLFSDGEGDGEAAAAAAAAAGADAAAPADAPAEPAEEAEKEETLTEKQAGFFF